MKKTFLILSCVALGLISCNKTEATTETSNFTPKLEKDTNTMELRNVAYKQIRDIFLDDSDSIEEAEIFYPSKMNVRKLFMIIFFANLTQIPQ